MKTSNRIVIRLNSFLFNNRKKMNMFTKITLLTLIIFYIIARISFFNIGGAVLLVSVILFAFISSPRSIIIDNYGIKYNLGRKEPWGNILSYKIEGTDLLLQTINNKSCRIRGMEAQDIPSVIEFINSKMQHQSYDMGNFLKTKV